MRARGMMRAALVLAVALALATPGAESKRVSGWVDKASDWVFLTKFCFDTDTSSHHHGRVRVTTQTEEHANQLNLFLDTADSWDAARNENNCTNVQWLAENTWNVPVSAEERQLGAFSTSAMDHPRFFFLTANNCDGHVDMYFDVEFINPGGAWNRQFSCEEQGLLPMFLFFFFLMLCGTGFHVYGVNLLRRADALHAIVKLLTAAIGMECASMFAYVLHLSVYASNGYGAPGVEGLGVVLHAASQLAMILLLVVLAKGWTVTTNELTQKRLLMLLMVAYSFAYFAFFIWIVAGRDAESTRYIYDSPPGIVIVLIRVLAWIWFAVSLRTTYAQLGEEQEAKKPFYRVLGAVYTFWFLSLPLIVAIGTGIHPWARLRIVTGFNLFVTLSGLGVIGFLLWPSRAAQFFKVVAQTSQRSEAGTLPYDEL